MSRHKKKGTRHVVTNPQHPTPQTPQQSNSPIMEVHHPHPIHHAKKWKDYVFEFLMLFLAISLGFFVENIREHYIEGKRAKTYVISLYDDFRKDTAIIARVMLEKEYGMEKMDSLMLLLDVPGQLDNDLIYYFERFMTRNDVFTAQDVTYRQLLSSGNFRYFEDIELYTLIAEYYNLYERYLLLGEGEFGKATEMHSLEAKLFDGSDLNSIYNPGGGDYYTIFRRPQRNLKKIPADNISLNELKIKAGNTNYSMLASRYLLGILNDQAKSILDHLRKEYHLE